MSIFALDIYRFIRRVLPSCGVEGFFIALGVDFKLFVDEENISGVKNSVKRTTFDVSLSVLISRGIGLCLVAEPEFLKLSKAS